MYAILLAVFLLLISTLAMAKHTGKGSNDHESKGPSALLVDLVTGECELLPLGISFEPPEGLKELGTYDSAEKAESAEANKTECKGSSGHHGAAQADEADCRNEAKKSDSNLLRLFSKLTSGATNHSIYVECMKGRGYDVKGL